MEFFNTGYLKDNLLLVILIEAAINLYINLRQLKKCFKANADPVRPFMKNIKMSVEEF